MTDPDDNRSGDVRAAAREKARQLRTSQQRKDRRRKALLSGGIVIGVLAIAAIVAVVIVSAIRPTVPGPKNMASDGVVIGAGLKVKATPAREGRNPATGGTIKILASKKLAFAPAKAVKDALNG